MPATVHPSVIKRVASTGEQLPLADPDFYKGIPSGVAGAPADIVNILADLNKAQAQAEQGADFLPSFLSAMEQNPYEDRFGTSEYLQSLMGGDPESLASTAGYLSTAAINPAMAIKTAGPLILAGFRAKKGIESLGNPILNANKKVTQEYFSKPTYLVRSGNRTETGRLEGNEILFKTKNNDEVLLQSSPHNSGIRTHPLDERKLSTKNNKNYDFNIAVKKAGEEEYDQVGTIDLIATENSNFKDGLEFVGVKDIRLYEDARRKGLATEILEGIASTNKNIASGKESLFIRNILDEAKPFWESVGTQFEGSSGINAGDGRLFFNKAKKGIESLGSKTGNIVRKMGDEFGTVIDQPVYHGSVSNFKDFKKSKQKTTGVSFAFDPENAKQYGPNIRQLDISKARLWDYRNPDDVALLKQEMMNQIAEGKLPKTIHGKFSQEKVLEGIDRGHALYLERPVVSNAMKKLGYDGHIGLETLNFGKQSRGKELPEEFWQQVKMFDIKKIKQIPQIKRIAPDKDTWDALNITEEGMKKWRNTREGAKLLRNKELEDASFALIDETIPLDKRINNFQNLLKKVYPLEESKYTPEQLQELIDTLPSNKEIAMSVGAKSKNKKIIGVNDTIKSGDVIELRLDIPAYKNTNTWVVTAHKPASASARQADEVIGYGRTGYLKNVSFENMDLGRTFQVQAGDVSKFPMSTMKGEWIDHNPKELAKLAKKLMDDPEWTQVGFNPKKSLQFYERGTMNPVLDAEEVIQVGNFVLAKKTTLGKPMENIYEVGEKGLRMSDRATTPGQTIPAGTKIPYSGGGLVQSIDIFGDN